MARDRFLLRADVVGYTYADILEVRPQRVRLLRPPANVRRGLRIALIGVAAVWVFLVGPLLYLGVPMLLVWLAWPGGAWPGWLVLMAGTTVWWVGLVAVLLWWDNRTLRILAKATADTTDLKVLEMTSYWTFQELKAATPQGEMRITVQGTRRKVGHVLRTAGVLPAAAA